jgi:aminoglycoside 3-N-acetyltransferase
MPSFNHGLAFAPGGPGYYDPRETPTNDGAIADLFWRLPGVHRSLDPTHAFAAWGRHASDYTQFHHRTLTAGPESPLGLLWRDGGFGLLLGAEYSSNTFHHVVETVTGAPCLGPRTEVYPVRLGDGRFVEGRTWGWRSEKCPLTSQGAYVAEMRAQGLQREGTIGRCRGLLFPLQGCFDVVADLLRRGTGSAAPCSGCAIRPRTVPQTVPSDWDVEHGCLRPDSTAWGY